MIDLDAPETRLDRLRLLRVRQEGALSGEIPARDFAAMSREYRATLAEIAELDPEAPEVDAVDEIARRRAARRSGPAKGAGRSKRTG